MLEGSDISHAIAKLDSISDKFRVNFVLSISMNERDLPECTKGKVIVSL